ncbi:hypothetical protein yc1106_06887 [Curvularia clavata]|uniref:Uncharacterized protein n=1 Tax=Curvularia clavata TaxID=95742 RepID=A0A9Q9DTA5_CURCL|nr:hypothetical protein yc1106_06887 [Curvularia clavata]
MPKHAHSESNTTPTNESEYNVDSDVFRPTKRCTPSTAPCVNTDQGCTLPLTHENLRVHTCSESLGRSSQRPQQPVDTSSGISGSMSARSGSPTRNAWDTLATLRAYRIEVDTNRELPADLKNHLDTVLARKRHGSRSPNASRVLQHRLAASLDNETTGIRRLEPLLLFAGEDDPSAIYPVPMISSKLNFNLSRDFLPLAPPRVESY